MNKPNNHINIDQIKDYLNGSLSSEQRTTLEQDEMFMEAIQAYKESPELLDSYARFESSFKTSSSFWSLRNSLFIGVTSLAVLALLISTLKRKEETAKDLQKPLTKEVNLVENKAPSSQEIRTEEAKRDSLPAVDSVSGFYIDETEITSVAWDDPKIPEIDDSEFEAEEKNLEPVPGPVPAKAERKVAEKKNETAPKSNSIADKSYLTNTKQYMLTMYLRSIAPSFKRSKKGQREFQMFSTHLKNNELQKAFKIIKKSSKFTAGQNANLGPWLDVVMAINKKGYEEAEDLMTDLPQLPAEIQKLKVKVKEDIKVYSE